jgi:hypothetical protein
MKRRVSPELADCPVCIQKDFLRQILSIMVIAAESQGESVHGSLVPGHK